MDYSKESYVHEPGSFPYDPEPFYTNQIFDSRQELTDWAQTVARSLGYVIITKRSHKNTRDDVCSVLLRCDRSGVYEGKGSTNSRATSTRKINCPFKLVGQLSNYGWRLVVKDHNHNHPPAEYLEGHSFARWLSADEKELVERLANLELSSRDIFAQLKAQFPANVSTIKDVYNGLQVIKDKKAAEVGSTPMQVMLSLLHENNYSYNFTTDANRLENLFFVHPKSFELWRVFPHVLIIDATYKTNIYNMPFVEIVGVTSTRKTFKVASAFITNEREDTYKWVLERLKQTLGGGMSVRVIITDRELALMNACRDLFSQAARLLCRFHIMQKIKADGERS